MSRALFASDLHLAGERPAATELFFSFLLERAARAQSLYLLGDLFESWAGDDELRDPAGDPLALAVAEALRRLRQARIPVYLVHGNRDFLIGEGFLAASGAQLLADPSVVTIAGESLALLHGDLLCTDDLDYQAWRRTARDPHWQREFLARPLAERHRLLQGLREQSKAAIATKPAQIMDVNAHAVSAMFRELGVRRMIHGHTHRPARHEVEVDGLRRERWVLPDWYASGGYLEFDEVGPRLVSF